MPVKNDVTPAFERGACGKVASENTVWFYSRRDPVGEGLTRPSAALWGQVRVTASPRMGSK